MLLMEMWNAAATLGKCWQFLIKSNIHLACDPEVSRFDIYPKVRKTERFLQIYSYSIPNGFKLENKQALAYISKRMHELFVMYSHNGILMQQ